jgi:hypothetical protein
MHWILIQVFSVKARQSAAAECQVFVTIPSINRTITRRTQDIRREFSNLQHYHYTFVANSTTTNLQFTDRARQRHADTLIDSVSVIKIDSLIRISKSALSFRRHGHELGCRRQSKIAQIAEGSTTPTHSAALSASSDSQGSTLSKQFYYKRSGLRG